MNWLDILQPRAALIFAPIHERTRSAAIGGAGVFVANVDGEEFEEAKARQVSGIGDQRGKDVGRMAGGRVEQPSWFLCPIFGEEIVE